MKNVTCQGVIIILPSAHLHHTCHARHSVSVFVSACSLCGPGVHAQTGLLRKQRGCTSYTTVYPSKGVCQGGRLYTASDKETRRA